MLISEFIVFCSILYHILCLEIEKLGIPERGILGKSVTFECKFRLGHKPLYSVKWYKGDDEIFRFMPDAKPSTKSFSIPGLYIDAMNSDMHKLVLANLTGNATGMYKCEVSTEGPIFETVFQVSNMTVIAFPDRYPVVTVDKYNYELGEDIFANCTSGKSYPASVLTWFLNGVKAEKSCVGEEGVIDVGKGRFRSFSRVRFRSRGDPGELVISCVGTVADLKSAKTSLIVKLEKNTNYNHLIHDVNNSGIENCLMRKLNLCHHVYMLITLKWIIFRLLI